ncbi:uncharacterized protein I303_104542 [Kwoniella dejecticola CBS 10117]|uniref:RNB domain-containing protein n=1 Tax=Kwoniella dejecticola CBS 10117 TaxID=1296121 RepID=A0A1A6A542_9TREE|nr:uncharacterized protein I303_04480 [Kwoniella dejecticola CBS 10117]OBR85148.1 hypothetical protein I303_04480 [Kwoniella dejecticola CBS 10117]
MASIYLKPTRGSSSFIRRSLSTSARISNSEAAYNTQIPPDPSSSSSLSTSNSSTPNQIKNRRTFEFLYGPGSNWRKPKTPSKPATPPKKRARVDPDAYKNLPPLEITAKERLVEFSIAEGQSNDRRAYFSSDNGDMGEDWYGAETAEDQVGLETGRVVECRRSGHTMVGLILASITLAGKQRLLILRSSGEIWPISSHDVQFVMPSSLISPSLVSECWSPELLEALAQSESRSGLGEESVQPTPAMLAARRKVAMVLRKVHRETEKMCGRLTAGTIVNGGESGGVEAVWDHFASHEGGGGIARTSITAVQAAEYILNPKEHTDNPDEKRIEIRPNTLPAYAAHTLLMRRPDLFTADQGDMWSTGTFIVRSRSERRLLQTVQQGVDGSLNVKSSEGNDAELMAFVERAKKVVELARHYVQQGEGKELKEEKHDLPEWSKKDKEYISILLSPLVETRSTQVPPSLPLSLSIARLILPNSAEAVDRGTLARLLSDLGIVLPWDSLEMSKLSETENRAMVMSNIHGTVRGEDELLKGNELDSLREDFTSHQVYVIDDPTASELDDGLALERIPNSDSYWIHVHIADPTRYIPPNHPLSKQASIRGSSAYLPEGNKPLFPLEVIMQELSLGADVQDNDGAQGTMTFSAKLTRNGEVDETKVRMGWIKKPRVVTYQAVDQALNLPTSRSTRPFGEPTGSSGSGANSKSTIDAGDVEDLRILVDLAKAHRAKRYANAGFEWSLPSATVNLLNKSSSSSSPASNLFDPSSLPSLPRLFSGSLGLDYKVSHGLLGGLNAAGVVAEFMILAGRIAASFCNERDIPIIYRGSSPPKPLTPSAGTLENLLSLREAGTGQIDPLKMMGSDWYRPSGFVDTKPLKHWIMGLDKQDQGYTRATSPLRRFDDILLHWQIKAYLAKQADISAGDLAKGFSREEVVSLVKRSDEGTKRARRAGINAMKFWTVKALQHNWNWTVNELVVGTSTNGLRSERTEGGDIPRIDLKNDILTAKIIGSSDAAPTLSGEMTPITIPSLGLQTHLLHSPRKGKGDWAIGEEVRCTLFSLQDWPNPTTTFKLVE